MKSVMFIIGLALVMIGYSNAQDQKPISKKIADGNSNTSFGMYRIEVMEEPVMLEGKEVTGYRVTYDRSPVSIIILIDKEEKCKNYIVVSEGLSIMYTCNGQYFGVNKIDGKYKKEGYVTESKNLNLANYFQQKIIVQGKQEEIFATSLIASYYPMLLK